MTAATTDGEILAHAFEGDDRAGPCRACGAGLAHPAHGSRYDGSDGHRQPQPQPEDRMIAALAPDGLDAEPAEGEAESALGDWTIADLDDATWCARRLHRANTRIARLAQLAADEHDRINRWLEGETARIAADQAYFEGRLRAFHEYALAQDPKNSVTIRLPNGSVLSSQAGKLAVEVSDVAALVAWAEAHECAEEILRYPEPEPNKVEIAKRFKSKAEQETEPGEYSAVTREDSEVVPGIKIVRKPRTFTVKGPADPT